MELIVVYVVVALIVIAWFAVCISTEGLKSGIFTALLVPIMLITVLGVFIYIIYCFHVVFS